jgi:hypothetical protein
MLELCGRSGFVLPETHFHPGMLPIWTLTTAVMLTVRGSRCPKLGFSAFDNKLNQNKNSLHAELSTML